MSTILEIAQVLEPLDTIVLKVNSSAETTHINGIAILTIPARMYILVVWGAMQGGVRVSARSFSLHNFSQSLTKYSSAHVADDYLLISCQFAFNIGMQIHIHFTAQENIFELSKWISVDRNQGGSVSTMSVSLHRSAP